VYIKGIERVLIIFDWKGSKPREIYIYAYRASGIYTYAPNISKRSLPKLVEDRFKAVLIWSIGMVSVVEYPIGQRVS